MSPISLSTSVAGIEVCFSPPASARIALAIALSGRTVRAHHEQRRRQPDQHADDAEQDALPFIVAQRPAEIGGEFPPPAGADIAQQVGHPPDLPAFGAEHFTVEIGNLVFGFGHRNDGVGIGSDRFAKRGIADRHFPHALGGPLGSQRIMGQQRLGNLVLRPQQVGGGGRIAHRCDRRLEPLARRRQSRDQLGAARDQRGDAVNALAVIGKTLRDAVDHVLLFGSEFQPGLFQKRAQRRHGLADPGRLRIRIGDEIARRQPQLVDPPVDLLGEVADALHPLQLGKGRVDMADRDDARHAGGGNHGQQQQKAAKGQLTDRQRKRPYPLDDGGKGHGRLKPAPGSAFYTTESSLGGTSGTGVNDWLAPVFLLHPAECSRSGARQDNADLS